MQASTSTDIENFHFHGSMEASTNYHDVNLLPPASLEISMEVSPLAPVSTKPSMQVSGNFYGSRSKK